MNARLCLILILTLGFVRGKASAVAPDEQQRPPHFQGT